MKCIYILCDSTFLNKSSGINTFVINLYKMLNKNYKVKIISDVNFLNTYEYNKYNIDYFNTKKISMNIDGYIEQYSNDMYEWIINNLELKNSVFIANSLSTTIVLDKLSKKYIDNLYISYTHIGDIIHEDYSKYDFPKDEISNYIKLLKNNNYIVIGTQSNELKSFLQNKYNFKNVEYLPEPLIFDTTLFTFPKLNNTDILIVCSNYKRKRLDIMLEAISKTPYNVKLICKDVKGYYDIISLSKKFKNKLQIIQNIPNEKIIIHMINSNMLLHISDIEFFPYSVLESSCFIPTLINSDTEWGKLFPEDICYKINNRDPNKIAEKIKEVINLPKKNDYYQYLDNAFKIWNNFLKDGD